MARPKRLNDAKSEVIQSEFLKQDPEGLHPAEAQVKVAKEVPKMETIVFRNGRDPGFPLEFHYHSETHPLHHYKLFDGQTVTLPVEIIEMLESRNLPIYAYRKGPDGTPQMYVSSYKYLYNCKPVRT